ncbi:MAG TPA: 2-oxoacid:acceptor oxidoreductase family protein [Anaerolineales bacterium]|nr:2-oxoacid:acceptor oxidoreductase family protein [Anaerolineales bacterium]
MQTEIVIAGFGGQGVLFAGQVLAYAAMDSGKHVTWFPSYGPEMRGGTANCTVIVADEDIGSPNVRNPQAVICLNLPSLDKYEPLVVNGGLLALNTSLINRAVAREDLHVVEAPANEMAEELGDKRLVNAVMLGALVEATGVLPMEAIQKALKDHLPAKHQDLLPANFIALEKGAEVARRTLAQPA